MNYRFDINEWLPKFPLDPTAERYFGEFITSPFDVCNNELLRQEMHDQYIWGESVPINIFVMALGEPPDRHVTKVGGLPYRPANAKWPVIKNGRPKHFVAQFDFSDSVDITGNLPGQILLIFADDPMGSIGSLCFEWQHLGLNDLVSSEEIPKQSSTFDPCYGHIFRTVSYPDAEDIVSSKKQKYPMCRGKEVWSDFLLLQYQAMQIGSAPFFVQGDPELPGQMLCTINSVQPEQEKSFPWINHPKPLSPGEKWSNAPDYLMIGDLGCIYISIDDQGKLHSTGSCF